MCSKDTNKRDDLNTEELCACAFKIDKQYFCKVFHFFSSLGFFLVHFSIAKELGILLLNNYLKIIQIMQADGYIPYTISQQPRSSQ